MKISFTRRGRRALGTAAIACVAVSAALSALTLSGCGGGNGSSLVKSGASSRKVGTVSMTIRWPQRSDTRKIPQATKSITLRITGTTGTQTKTVARPADSTTSTITLTNIPLGEFTLTGTAYPNADGSGIALAKASSAVTLSATANVKSVSLDLATTVVRIGASPSPLRIAPGGPNGTATLAVTGYDSLADTANMVPVVSLSFVSADPTVASVDPTSGLVTGVNVGNTVITVTDNETGLTTTVNVEVARIATPLWSQVLDGPVRTTPLIASNGNVYIGSSQGKLYGFTSAGAPLLGFPVTLGIDGQQISSPVITSAGILYAVGEAGTLYAVDSATGVLKSSTTVAGSYVSAVTIRAGLITAKPVLSPDETKVYVPTTIGTILAVAVSDSTITTINVADAASTVNTPTVEAATGNLYVTSSTLSSTPALLHALKPDGTEIFAAVALDGSLATGTALGTNGKVYAAVGLSTSETSKVYAFDAATGVAASGFPVDLPDATLVTGAVALSSDNTVYIGTWGTASDDDNPIEGQVFALDGETGAVKPGWPFKIPFTSDLLYSDVYGAITIGSDGTAYFGSYNGKAYALSSTASLVYDATLLDPILAAPAVTTDGTAIFGTDNGSVTALK